MEENKPNGNDEEYGLPDVSYDPVNREQAIENDPPVKRRFEYDEKKSSGARTIGIVVVLLLIAGAVFGYFYFLDQPEQEISDNQFTEPEPIQPANDNLEEDFSNTPVPDNTEPADWENAAPAKPVKGEISRVTERTGRSYIVVASFIDDDLAMDYGNKLAVDGVNSKIIAPYGDKKYYRFSITDYPTIKEALSHVEELKATYGNDIWVLKY